MSDPDTIACAVHQGIDEACGACPECASVSGIEPWRYGTWEILSYGWTEIGIEREECQRLVQTFGIGRHNWAQVRKVCYRDVCASFAVLAFLVIPLCLWMLMPDWGFGEAWMRKRMKRWYARPYLLHFLNPLRVLGYPVALLFAAPYFLMMKRIVFDPKRE